MNRLSSQLIAQVFVSVIAMNASVASSATWFGTAFAIGDGYTYVTNEHVVNGAKTICFRTLNGQAGKAKVVSTDASDDIVLLRGNINSPPLVIGSSQEIEKGMNVLAVGFPVPSIMGLEAKVTEGIVNALSGVGGDRRRFQFSASIQPGNSGGPLLNESGRVVGVVVSRLGKKFTEATGQIADSVGYGIHIARLRSLIEITPPLGQFLSTTVPSIQKISKTRLIAQVEPSVVLIVASDTNESCASDYDVEIPEFGVRAKSRSEVERERQELNRIVQARLTQEREERLRRERELASAKEEEEAKKLAERKAKEEAEAGRRLAVKKYVNELVKRYPGFRTLEGSPGFCVWTMLTENMSCTSLDESDSSDRIESVVLSYAKAVGVSEPELRSNLSSEAREKIEGKSLLVRGALSQIDLRYGYGIARFGISDKRISHLLLRSSVGTWHVVSPSRVAASSTSRPNAGEASNAPFLAISFNIPVGFTIDRGEDVFGVDESFLKKIAASK